MARLGLRTLRKPNTDGFIKEIKTESENSILLSNSEDLVQSSSTHGSEHSSDLVQSSSTHGSNKVVHGSPRGSDLVQSSSTHGSNFDLDTITEPQKKLLYFLYLDLSENRSQITRPYKAEKLAEISGCKVDGIRTIIKRFRKKEYLKLESFKDSGSGWSKYSLSEAVYNQIKLNEIWFKKNSFMVQSSFRPRSGPSSGRSSEAPCSSSDLNINNINTTTQDSIFLNIPKNLQGQLPLNQLRSMLKSGAVDEITLEDSLWGFSHDLEKGLVKSKTGNTTGLFMGALRNGGYISQQYLSQKQSELLEIKERLAELKKITEELKVNDLAREFESYRSSNPELAEKLKPSGPFIKTFDVGSMGYRLWLEEYKKSTEPDQNIQNENVPTV
jgi:hypothetical protein